MNRTMIVSCEHARNTIPARFRDAFQTKTFVSGPWGHASVSALLEDHWGWDPGALRVAQYLHRHLHAPLFTFPVSRLLIEGNRYRQRSLFCSPFMESLSDAQRKTLYETYWIPYVTQLRNTFQTSIAKKQPVLHLSIHTFTPNHHGNLRKTDVGILYDPRRLAEKKFADTLHARVQKTLPNFQIRRNHPYLGTTESLVKLFRKSYANQQYRGIEIEINNKHVRTLTPSGKKILQALSAALGR